MEEENLASGVVQSVGAALLDAAKESEDLKRAGRTVGKSLATIATTIDNALLPLAALNFGIQAAKEYFSNRFQSDFSEKISDIPAENLVDPKPSVAGPALQGLSFSIDEPHLKELYLNLLKTAVDGRVSETAHPAFVEIIKQMTSDEAAKFKLIANNFGSNPMARFKMQFQEGGFRLLDRYVIDLHIVETQEAVFLPSFEKMFENWQRLGLVEADFARQSKDDDMYDWVQKCPRYIELKAQREDGCEVQFDKGIYELTKLGESFAKAVGLR